MSVKQLRSRPAYYSMPTQGKKEELKRRLLEMCERYQQRENRPAPYDPYPMGQLPSQQKGLQANVRHESHSPMKTLTATETPGRQATELQGSQSKDTKACLRAELQMQLKQLEDSDENDSSSSDSDEENYGDAGKHAYQRYQSDGQQRFRDADYRQPAVVQEEKLVFEKLPAPTPPIFDGDVLMYSDWNWRLTDLLTTCP